MTAATSRTTLPDRTQSRTQPERSARPALRLVVRDAPRREPPFEDELTEAPAVGRLDQPLPFAAGGRPALAAAPPLLAARPRTADPAPWGRRLLIGLIEVAEGRRALNQLGALLSFSVTRGIGSELERSANTGRRHWLTTATVRTVRASEPTEGVAELFATLDSGPRVRAVAMRLQREGSRWRCTRLHLG